MPLCIHHVFQATHASIVVGLNCLALPGREQLGRATPETTKNGALQGGLLLNLAGSLVLLFVLCFVLTVTANRLEPIYNI